MRVRSSWLAVVVGTLAMTGALAVGTSSVDAGPARGRPAPTSGCDGHGRSLAVVGLTSDGELLCFDEHRPSKTATLGTISGLTVDTRLVGLDFRPANGDLVGLGDAGGLYRVDVDTAAVTLLSRLNVALSGTSFGVDFNPAVDRLRIVSNTGQNLRANVADGVTTTDGVLAHVPPAGQSAVPAQGVAGAAYTNNDADPNTATTLFDVDTNLDQLAIQAPPNAGVLNPTGKLLLDAANEAGFDIHSHVRGGTTVSNRALAVLRSGDSTGLYRIDLLTGTALLAGTLPSVVIDLAIPLDQ